METIELNYEELESERFEKKYGTDCGYTGENCPCCERVTFFVEGIK